MKQRILSIILSVVLILNTGVLPVTAAEDVQDSGVTIGASDLCEHHTEHDETCGFTEATQGVECTHQHDETCGYTATVEETPCNHEHNLDCGYIESREEIPCDYICQECNEQTTDCICTELCTEDVINSECEVCASEGAALAACEGENVVDPAVAAVQSLIAALPEVDTLAAMSTEEQDDVYHDLLAADEAYQALKEEQKGQLAGENAKLNALFAYFSSKNMAATAADATTPTVDTTGKIIFANGTPISIEEGSDGKTKVSYNNGITLIEDNLSAYIIYGGNDSGIVNSTNITMTGGTVDIIYGGSLNGTVDSTSITITGGTVKTVYGGGNGGSVTGNTTVTVNSGAVGFIYGGSNNGTVTGDTNVTISGGDVYGYVYGGGNDDSSVTGSAKVTISGGEVYGGVYGGSEAGGVSIGTTVKIENGTIHNSVYGGGSNGGTISGKASVEISGGTVDTVYGGGNDGSVGNTEVIISGTVNTVYGGYNDGTVSGKASVKISGGTVNNSIYGGGYGSSVGSTEVIISSGTVNDVYGGGFNNGNVTGDTNVTISGGEVLKVYGGGNVDSSVSGSAKVTIDGGTVSKEVYGGGSLNDTVDSTEVIISSGTVNTVYGGGYNGGTVSGKASVEISGGTVNSSVYGGGNRGSVGSTEVIISGGTVGDSRGSNIIGGDATDSSTLTITGGSVYARMTINNSSGGSISADTIILGGSAHVMCENGIEGSITIHGGIYRTSGNGGFTGAPDRLDGNGTSGISYFEYVSADHANIVDVSSGTNEEHTIVCKDGNYCKLDLKQGHDWSRNDVTGVACSVCDAEAAASVTASGASEPGYYRFFANALSAAENAPGSTLKLFADVETITVDKGGFILDPNGKTITDIDFESGSSSIGIASKPGNTPIVTREVLGVFATPSGVNPNPDWFFAPTGYVVAFADNGTDLALKESIKVADITSTTYNEQEQKPILAVTATVSNKTLTEGTDYTVDYQRDGETTTDFTNAGDIKIIVTGMGNYTGEVEKTYIIVDEMPPNGEIKIRNNNWKDFINDITFGFFFKDTVDVAITADGTGSDVAKVEYLLSNTALTENSIPDNGWTELKAGGGKYSFSIEELQKAAVYVRIFDEADNQTVINSQGIVVYTDSKEDTTKIEYTYKENADKKIIVTLNGNTVNSVLCGGTPLTAGTDYTVDEDTITMKASYLNSLRVGDYGFTVTYNPQGVEYVENTGNEAPSATTFQVMVQPTELTVTEATATSRNYNGTNVVGITSVTLDGIITGDAVSVDLTGVQGTLSSANAETYTSVTLPKLTLIGTDAGNYTLVQPEGAVATSVTINKLDAEIKVDTASYDKTFGDAAFTLDVTENNVEADVQYAVTAGDDVISVSNGTVTIKKAGSATIEVSLPASTNYNAADSKTITVNVAKKSGYTVDEINRGYLHSRDNADTIDIAKLLPADCGIVTYGTATSPNAGLFSVAPSVSADGKLSYTVKSGSVGDAGTITLAVTTDNYAGIMITVNVTLTDKTPVSLKENTAVTLKNNTLTYREALSKLKFNTAVFVDDDGNTVAGTLVWKEPAATPNAGTVSATWIFTPNNAEYASVEGTVAITVNKATPTVTAVPTVAEQVYNPNVKLTDIAFNNGTVTGVDGNALSGTWSWQTANIVPVVNNSGYVAVFTPNDETNYETVTRTITMTVEKATPFIASVSGTTITYGDTLGASTVSGTAQYSNSDNTTVAGSCAWKDTDVKPTVADSDSTTYAVVFTPADTVNYNTVETTATLTVNKAENAPNMPGSIMNVSNKYTKIGDVPLPDGWEWQETDKETALEVDTPVTATAVYTGADKDNYKKVTVQITVTRNTCDHVAGSILYTGEGEKAPTCTESGVGHKECKECGTVMESSIVVKALGHTGGTATCFGKAVCTRCKQSYGSTDGSRHGSTEVRGYAAATCTSGGYTGDTYCKDCGTKLSSGTSMGATGHNYTSEITKKPATTEEGVMTYTCSVCKHTYTKAIEKLADDGSDNDGDKKPDTGKPFIEDDEGKEGWDVIRDEVEDAKDGDTVTVDMNGATVVPGDVFDDIKGRDITIVFDMGNGITWSVNGKDITSDNVGDIDFGVKVGTEENPIDTIPVEVINKVTGERYFMNISLAYDGEFGFKAVLSLNMDAKNAGLYANLFYFNEQKDELEFICADEIAADGTAELTFTHASEYTIIIDANTMEPTLDTDDTPDEPEADGTQDVPETSGTTDDAWKGWWIILLGAVIMVIGFGVFFIRKKKDTQGE